MRDNEFRYSRSARHIRIYCRHVIKCSVHLWKSLFTIKNGSKIQYKTIQDSGNTYVKTEEHIKLHVSSILYKTVIK